MMKKKTILFLTLSMLFTSCSMDRFIIRQTGTLLDYIKTEMKMRKAVRFGTRALASNINLLEGLLKGDPENIKLRLLTSQALSGYALGFVEDTEPDRARNIYLRARDHAMIVLRMNEEFAGREKQNLEEYEKAISTFEDEDIGALFWAAFSWAGWINLSMSDPQAFIDLPKVQVMMQKVLDMDETFSCRAVWKSFARVWGMKPRMLGGDPDKAKEFFDRNLEITNKKFLLTYIYYARYYAEKTLDEECFDECIRIVEDTPVNILPEYQLLNAIAKKKANRLKEKREDLF